MDQAMQQAGGSALPVQNSNPSRYEKTEKIGEGTYGTVYKGTDTQTGLVVALKRIRIDTSQDQMGIPSSALREIAVMKKLDHVNILRLLDVYLLGVNQLYLVFNYMKQGDLKAYWDKNRLSPLTVKALMKQLLEGLAYCHARSFAHRDLKPQNLLVDDSGILKIADFGLARSMVRPPRAYTHEVVTLWYRAPEVLLGLSHYGLSVDLWAAGCIFAEMAHPRNAPIFPGDSEVDEIFRVFRTLGTPDEEVWPGVSSLPDFNSAFPKWRKRCLKKIFSTIDPQAVELLEMCLRYNPDDRITAQMALLEPYFVASSTSPPLLQEACSKVHPTCNRSEALK